MKRLLACVALCASLFASAQDDCELFNIQEIAAELQNTTLDTAIIQTDGSIQVQLSNGNAFQLIFGCTDAEYMEYEASANADDGSCATLIVSGCTDPAFIEYDINANTDDGSCTNASVIDCTPVTMDGYDYSVVAIGNQCWFAENLRTTVYADGSVIPEVTNNLQWSGYFAGARCSYDNNPSNAATYGELYNFPAVTNASELCPNGWHVPTDEEWTVLEDYIGVSGHSGTEGAALRATAGWHDSDDGTDDYGFSAIPGGYRHTTGMFYYGGSPPIGEISLWWSSSSSPRPGYAWYRALWQNTPTISRDDGDFRLGFSVRCLKDAE